MPDYPTGMVAFLFTDIEGSTALWERNAASMRLAVERHLALLGEAISAQGGVHFKTVGDAVQAAFPSAPAAVRAAIEGQQALLAEAWGETGPIHVRMAIHIGEATPKNGDYLAPALNRLARLLSTGHGGQILVTEAVQSLIRDALPARSSLRDLGKHRLKDLLEPEHVFQLVHPDLAPDFPPLKSLDARPHNLPHQPNPFIGRERELAQVTDLLRDDAVSLLTLTGPGGSGKTRLALQAGADVLDSFPDGVFLVSLASVADAALVPATIASALLLREDASRTPRELLLSALADKRMLLILDNLEHLPGASPFIAELLAAAPTLTILATSRAPLNLRAERELPVPPLPLPPSGAMVGPDEMALFDAVRLFVDRAQSVQPRFSLNVENAAAVGEIVRRLDGLPLAIELAAARVRLFTPSAMLSRLGKRLPLLTGGARDLPARQQALRETIAWSYDLLDPPDQRLFLRLAVFAGGMTLEAAEALGREDGDSDETLAGIERLVQHSLVQAHVPERDGGPRLSMLETIREFGLEQLASAGGAESVYDMHAALFLQVAEEAAPLLDGPGQVDLLNTLETEHDNIRAALDWLANRENSGSLARLAAALWPFWDARGHYAEGRGWLERVIAISPAEPTPAMAAVFTGAGSIARMQGDADRALELLARALTIWEALGDRLASARVRMLLGHVADRQGDLSAAAEHFGAALAIGRDLGDTALIGSALANLGIVADERGESDLAIKRYEEALVIFRQLGDRRREAGTLDNLGIVARSRGDLTGAKRWYEEALILRRETGDAWGTAATLGNLGVAAHQEGNLAEAQRYYEESLAGFRALGDRRGVANLLGNLGAAARQVGEFARAAGLYREAINLSVEIGNRLGVADDLEGIAAVAGAAGYADRAARLFGAAEALREVLGSIMSLGDRPDYEQTVAIARDRIDRSQFDAAWAAGRQLAWNDAAAEALALANEIAQAAPASIAV